MEDKYDLARFVAAQEGTYDTALSEIRRGAKRSHWMWFVFPQIESLGSSAMSARYAIRSIKEARAYLAHPLLGRRLRECVAVLQDVIDSSAVEVFGAVDAAKLRSSLTLFLEAHPEPLMEAALARWFNGVRDDATLARLAGRKDD